MHTHATRRPPHSTSCAAATFARLDAGGHVYLDYTGAGLYAELQLRDHIELLRHNVFGNPHSLNPTSSAMTELVTRCT